MILHDYLKDFDKALNDGDTDESLFQLHQMLQRDPLDQKGEILSALKRLRTKHPNLPDDLNWKPLPPENASVEEQELAFGNTLQLFEDCPTEETLQRLRTLAQRLIRKGHLEAAVYEERSFPGVIKEPLHGGRLLPRKGEAQKKGSTIRVWMLIVGALLLILLVYWLIGTVPPNKS